LESTAATCLLTKDLRLGSSERSVNELLGTDLTGLTDKAIDQWLTRISLVMQAKG